MKILYHIWDDDNDKILVSFSTREDAFKVLKEKSLVQSWRSFEIRESQVLDAGEELTPILYYRASCGLADEEITVKEEKYFIEFDEIPSDQETSEVTIAGTDLNCEGRDLEKVCTKLRKYIANKRYEYEVAVRKICNVIQPKLENGEAMTINQICDETNVAQDIVVKVLLLLKKEGFLNIVDPLEQQKEAKTAPPKKKDTNLYLPRTDLPRTANAAYQQSSGLTNVGFDKKGRLRKKNPNSALSGKQAFIPIHKKRP